MKTRNDILAEYVRSRYPEIEKTFDFAACIPRGALLRHECALEQGRAGIQLHLHRAGAALAQAKELHDELESFYVPNMDFAKWQTILDRTLESLK